MSGGRPHVHFVLDPRATRWLDIERLGPDDIAAQPMRFVGGRNSWIARTYVQLRSPLEALGWRVTAGPGFVPGAIAVAHRDDVNRFASSAHRSFLVVVRADRAPAHACDLAIAQNRLGLDPHERYLPLWPQPGLAPRDPSRGSQLRRMAYMGRTGSSPWWFADVGFRAALAARGIVFEARATAWDRYDDVDVVLATREERPAMLASKPATKLYNGWLAGTPVLAAPEPAYRELRRTRLDFLEIAGPGDVLAAADSLIASPTLYGAMVRNGHARASEFSVERTRDRWIALLQDDAWPRLLRSRERLRHRMPWFIAAMARQKVASRAWRCRLGLEEPAALASLAADFRQRPV